MKPAHHGKLAQWEGVIGRYRAYLPVSAKTPVVTLLEGGTPLVPAPRRPAARFWEPV